MFVALSCDKEWGGFYISTGYGWRICLGYVALTWLPVPLDETLRLSIVGGKMENERRALGGHTEAQ